MKQVLNESTRADLQLSIKHIKETLANLSGITYKLDTLVGSEKRNLAGIIRNMESITANLRDNNEKLPM